jgi:2-amino-4-hydroxy-6-hydroxymethyldihydropteridine diphosphokinase
MYTYYLSLGSNIGDRISYLQQAIVCLQDRVGDLVQHSPYYYSQPWGYQSDNEYINIAIKIHSSLTPMQLLIATQAIERELGRVVKGIYSDRTIDIDILLAFDALSQSIVVHSDILTIPHPKMFERPFVMVPLQQIYDEPIELSSIEERTAKMHLPHS